MELARGAAVQHPQGVNAAHASAFLHKAPGTDPAVHNSHRRLLRLAKLLHGYRALKALPGRAVQGLLPAVGDKPGTVHIPEHRQAHTPGDPDGDAAGEVAGQGRVLPFQQGHLGLEQLIVGSDGVPRLHAFALHHLGKGDAVLLPVQLALLEKDRLDTGAATEHGFPGQHPLLLLPPVNGIVQQAALLPGLQLVGGHQFFLGHRPEQFQLYRVAQGLDVLFLAAAGAFGQKQAVLLKQLDPGTQLGLELQLAGIADEGVAAQHLQPQLEGAVLLAAGDLHLHGKGHAAPDDLPAVLFLLLAEGLDLHRALQGQTVLAQGLLFDLAGGKGGKHAVDVGLGVGNDDLGGDLLLGVRLGQDGICFIAVLNQFHACSPSVDFCFIDMKKRGQKDLFFQHVQIISTAFALLPLHRAYSSFRSGSGRSRPAPQPPAPRSRAP